MINYKRTHPMRRQNYRAVTNRTWQWPWKLAEAIDGSVTRFLNGDTITTQVVLLAMAAFSFGMVVYAVLVK